MSALTTALNHLSFKVDKRAQTANVGWFRGENCNFNPNVANLKSKTAVEDYILKGWLPEEKFIYEKTSVAAFGSCFAHNIKNYLASRNYNILTKGNVDAHVVNIAEGLVNTYAIRQQLEWAFEGKTPKNDIWHGFNGESYGYEESTRRNTLRIFERTDVFILTLGLSEVWFDEPTGEVFWRAIPMNSYDSSRHKFRVTSVEENKANIIATTKIIHKYRPSAQIIFTLSPIPLVATFRPNSCITSNAVSKSILRAALDEALRELPPEEKFHYWPSYEIVLDAFGPGKFVEDRRHIKAPVLDYIMRLFEEHYCVGSAPDKSLIAALVDARLATGELSGAVVHAIRQGHHGKVRSFVGELLAQDDWETADLLLAYATELHPTAPSYAVWAKKVRAFGQA